MGQIIATLSEMRSGQVKVPLDTRTKIIVTPDAMQCEIVGKLFDPGKTFLGLDSAVEGLRYVHRLAARVASGKDVLIVVHTEPLSDASKSEQLSRDRAAMVAAWFEGDVQAWLDNYADSLPKKERWGAREDQRMLGALGGFGAVSEDERPTNADARYDALVRGFQRSRGLTDDGIAGPVTRKQLVQEYFALAKVDDKFEPVPTGGEPAKLSVNLAQHGAGPHFSLADAEAKRQAARAAAKAAANSGAPGARPAKSDRSKGATSNRAQPDPSGADADTSSSPQPAVHARLDIFIFFNKEGMDPAPGSADGGEFLEWVALASGGHRRFRAEASPPKQVKLLPFPAGCFRTGSAVLLPGTATPVDDAAVAAPATLSSVAALAMALRFNEERPGHQLLVAGHTDSVGSDRDNDQLSKQRAQVAHAVMMGDRDTFVSLADETGTVSDWRQVLQWASLAFPSIEELVSDEEQERAEENEGGGERHPAGTEGEMGTGFSACDPGTIDDDARSAKPAVEAFQTAYNENYKLLGGGGTISVDGIVGKQTWGAIYDLYQYNLAQELGEDFEGLKSLRELVEFLPTKNPYIGFGEHHPADGNFNDNTESHANRRVEVLFFEQGYEPELEILDEAPELTELYENEAFVIGELVGDSAKSGTFIIRDVRLPYEMNPDVEGSGERAVVLVAQLDDTEYESDDEELLPGFPGYRMHVIRGVPGGRFDIFEVINGARFCVVRDVIVGKRGIRAQGKSLDEIPEEIEAPDIVLGEPATYPFAMMEPMVDSGCCEVGHG